MDIRKIITGLTLSMLLVSGVAVAADFDKGSRAYESGDYRTALAEWTPLAQQGSEWAQMMLGIMYDNGVGVSKSNKTAAMWYTLSAKQGNAMSQNNLGKKHFNGDGVIQNDKTAFIWYSLAAEQGLDLAQHNLGVMYQFGFGVLTDYKKAYMWYNIAASNGSNAAADGKITIAKSMNSSQIDKAQDMSNRCLGSGYTDC